MSKKQIRENSVTLKKGSEHDLPRLVEKLAAAGFARFDAVEGRGQISVRGSILDIFPVNSDKPVRIEFWDDEIDRMSYFEAETQRRTDDIDEIRIAPNTELLLRQRRTCRKNQRAYRETEGEKCGKSDKKA